MLNPIAVIFCLLIIGVCGYTENDIEDEESRLNDVYDEGNLRWPRIFEIFEVCEVSCIGKTCRCCHQVLSVMEVCGALYIDPTTKTAEISLIITGRKAVSRVIALNPYLNLCHTTNTNLGEADICSNITISEHSTNPDSFRICIEAEVQLNKVKHLNVKVNCLEFRGDLIFESGNDDAGTGKNIASVRILNQMLLANVIGKAVMDNIIG